MTSNDVEDLLFTDIEGSPISVEDLMDEGPTLYLDRIPSLRELVHAGSPYHRLLAAALLTAWGQPDGFESVIRWANDPRRSPWADEPVTFDRFSGTDSAFEVLADAVRTSFWEEPTATLRALQAEALRALLGASTSHFVGRSLSVAASLDYQVAREIEPALRRALDTTLGRIERGDEVDFDLSWQVATLITPLARIDDESAAAYAERLIRLFPRHQRMLREVVDALSVASGPTTAHVLERLAQSEFGLVRKQAQEALSRRPPPV